MDTIEEIKKTYDYLNNTGRYGGSFHAQKWLPFVKVLDVDSVLDVGTGRGEFCNWAMEELCNEVHGLDISIDPRPEFMHKNINFIKGVSHEIPLSDKSVDMTTSWDVLEHVHPQFLEKTIDEMFRVTRKCMFHRVAAGPSHSHFAKVGQLHLIQKSRKDFWLNEIFVPRSKTAGILNGGIIVIL